MAKVLEEATAEIERVADAIMAAEYMIVCGGSAFDDASSSPFDSEHCVSTLIKKPNVFMGFWGQFYNEYLDKVPHEGYNILSKLRDKLFCSEDIRKRNKKTKGDVGEEDQFLRFMVYTGHIGNSFQKGGIPDQEMMEVYGNITHWQCGVQPICSARTFSIERGFKFYIDPLTHDALPIRYVAPTKGPTEMKSYRQPFVDSDEEEEAFRAGIARDPYIKGASADDRARRAQRLRNYARAVRLSPQLQLIAYRFPDLFTGFVTTVGGKLETFTFDGLGGAVDTTSTSFMEAQRRNMFMGEAPASDPAGGGGAAGGEGADATSSVNKAASAISNTISTNTNNNAKNNSDNSNAPPPPSPKCGEPVRVSHLLAHTNALDRGMYEDRRGAFSVVEVDRWRMERDGAFAAIGRGPMASETYSVSSRREKTHRYNVSMVLTSEDGSVAIRGGSRACVLPAELRERLMRPYGGGEGAAEEAAINDLMSTEMKDWRQSSNGWYYFSNVPLQRTQQEPVHNSYSDFLKIDFPKPLASVAGGAQSGAGASLNATARHHGAGMSPRGHAALNASNAHSTASTAASANSGGLAAGGGGGAAAYELPTKGLISIVCEAVILAEGEHVPPPFVKHMQTANSAAGPCSKAKRNDKSSDPPNPYVYTNNVWQIVGRIDTTIVAKHFGLQTAGPSTTAGGALASDGGSSVPVATIVASPYSTSRDGFEYILEGRKGHVIHIGSLKSRPQVITYIHLEVPHDDWGPQGIATRLIRPMRDNGSSTLASTGSTTTTTTSGGSADHFSGDSGMDGRTASNGRGDELVPALNHILCLGCREIARPYVYMTSVKAGVKKDEGFASAVMTQRNRAFKLWEKSIIDGLKQDQNKSIVILEVGSDRKPDIARTYAEKTYKLLKMSKCTFVRLCEYNLDAKPKSGSSTESTNYVPIICNPIAGLQALERAVNERIKKITK